MNNNNGVTAAEILQIVLIVLKLCGVIHWSWLLVLLPTWIGLVLAVAVTIFLKWLNK